MYFKDHIFCDFNHTLKITKFPLKHKNGFITLVLKISDIQKYIRVRFGMANSIITINPKIPSTEDELLSFDKY